MSCEHLRSLGCPYIRHQEPSSDLPCCLFGPSATRIKFLHWLLTKILPNHAKEIPSHAADTQMLHRTFVQLGVCDDEAGICEGSASRSTLVTFVDNCVQLALTAQRVRQHTPAGLDTHVSCAMAVLQRVCRHGRVLFPTQASDLFAAGDAPHKSPAKTTPNDLASQQLRLQEMERDAQTRVALLREQQREGEHASALESGDIEETLATAEWLCETLRVYQRTVIALSEVYSHDYHALVQGSPAPSLSLPHAQIGTVSHRIVPKLESLHALTEALESLAQQAQQQAQRQQQQQHQQQQQQHDRVSKTASCPDEQTLVLLAQLTERTRILEQSLVRRCKSQPV